MRHLVVVACIAASYIVAPQRSLALQFVEGKIGAGTVYGIWVPDNWNRELVLYAHGFRNPNCPLVVPTNPGGLPATQLCPDMDSGTPATVTPVRDMLLSLGYAFAASSYSATGFAVKEGTDETLQLRNIFVSRYPALERTYLYGHSMGGAIVLKLAEQHPAAFDAALAMCGMLDGTPAEAQYALDARATFDAIFPGVVPGGVASVPPNLTFYYDVAPAVVALFDPRNPNAAGNFAKARAWASIAQVAFAFTTPEELENGILEFLFVETLGTPGVVKAAHGFPADNTGVIYTGPVDTTLDLSAVNAAAERVAAVPQALAWAEHWYDTTGAISFPVLSVHTVRDAAVPLLHERNYAAKVAAAGRSGLLVQRTVSHPPRPGAPDGHCSFKLAEELAAFADLVQWVHTGVRPAGGDATVP